MSLHSTTCSCIYSFKFKAIRDLALTVSSFLEDFGTTHLVLQWIPSHCDIPGNERADVLAKKGAAKEQPNKLVSQATAKQIIKSNSKTEWKTSWTQSEKGRAMFKYIPKPNRKDPINLLKRKDKVIIFRLRTTHIQLNTHLSRITKDHPPACTLCGYREETVNHFLFDCPTLQNARNEFLPPNPDLENTLFSDKQQLLKTSRYFQKANQQRAQAQD